MAKVELMPPAETAAVLAAPWTLGALPALWRRFGVWRLDPFGSAAIGRSMGDGAGAVRPGPAGAREAA